MVESEEGDGVGHHPDVAAAAVVVRLVPLPVLVTHRQYRLLSTVFFFTFLSTIILFLFSEGRQST